MKRRVVIALATAVGIWAAPFSAHAHHSYGAFFDLCRSVTIEGRVENIQWKDPHVWINLTTDGGTAYRVEWTSLRGLSNRGITAESLKAGDSRRGHRQSNERSGLDQGPGREGPDA